MNKKEKDSAVLIYEKNLKDARSDKFYCSVGACSAMFFGIASLICLGHIWLHIQEHIRIAFTVVMASIVAFEIVYFFVCQKLKRTYGTLCLFYEERIELMNEMHKETETLKEVQDATSEWMNAVGDAVNVAYLSCSDNIARLILICDSGSPAIRKKSEELRKIVEKKNEFINFDILLVMNDGSQNPYVLDDVMPRSLKFIDGSWDSLL